MHYRQCVCHGCGVDVEGVCIIGNVCVIDAECMQIVYGLQTIHVECMWSAQWIIDKMCVTCMCTESCTDIAVTWGDKTHRCIFGFKTTNKDVAANDVRGNYGSMTGIITRYITK